VFKPKLEEGKEQIAVGFSNIYKLVSGLMWEHFISGRKIGAFGATNSGIRA